MKVAYSSLYNEHYHGHAPGARSVTDALPQAVLTIARGKQCGRVLDIGAGSGISRSDLTQLDRGQVAQVSSVVVDKHASHLTTCFDVLQHIGRSDLSDALWKIKELSGEWLAASVSTRPSGRYNAYHTTIIPAQTWLKLFAWLGFELVDSSELDSLHSPITYGDNDDCWCMNHWRQLDPYRDTGDRENHYFLLRRTAGGEPDFVKFDAQVKALLGPEFSKPTVKIAPDLHLTFLLGHYQEFLLYTPFFESLAVDSYRVLIRSAELSALEPRRKASMLAYFKAYGICHEEIGSVRDLHWPEELPPRRGFLTATESTATSSHLINAAFAIEAKLQGAITFQLQHGIWPHAEFPEPIVFVSDHILAWSEEFRSGFRRTGKYDLSTNPTDGEFPKFHVTGCPKFDAYSAPQSATAVDLLGAWAAQYQTTVLVATNLHWPLHSLGKEVLPQLSQTATEMPETLFLYKLHPAHEYDPTVMGGLPKNVVVVDEFASLYGGLTTSRLVQAADAVICTLSTVALEAALALRPLEILETGNPNSYAGTTPIPISGLTKSVHRLLSGAECNTHEFLATYYQGAKPGLALATVLQVIEEAFALNLRDSSTQAHELAKQAFSSAYVDEHVQRSRSAAEIHAKNVEAFSLSTKLLATESELNQLQAALGTRDAEIIALRSIVDSNRAELTRLHASLQDQACELASLHNDLNAKSKVNFLNSPVPFLASVSRSRGLSLSPIPRDGITGSAGGGVLTSDGATGLSDEFRIQNRDHFPELLDKLGLRGIGVELGVAAGAYSEHILAHSRLTTLFSIDRWSDHHDDAEYEFARNVLSKWGGRSVILRRTFQDAIKLFADKLFDFIFVDGYAHAGQDGIGTLDAWWPKLRAGGIFAGHDYHSSWPLTMDVVDRFAEKTGRALYTTNEDPTVVEHAYPSWYVLK